MIDLHTHFLPDWDDGAEDWPMVDRMAAVAKADGISGIALTPHVYRATKHGKQDGRDLKARTRAFIEQALSTGIDFFSGSEVYIHPEMIAHIKEFDLTINGSNYVFIEFPAQTLPTSASSLLYQLMLAGIVPIISHPERNAAMAGNPESLYDLVRQGAVAQVTAQSITGGFGETAKRAAETFVRHHLVHLIASDAHNAGDRAPRLAAAVEAAAKWVGRQTAEAMVTTVPAAILKNEEIPSLGEPQVPEKKGLRRFFFR